MKHFFTITLCFLALSLSVYGQVPDYVPSDGLVAWYPFNGNANDELNPSDISEIDGAELSIDRFGLSDNAYYFDGYDDQIITNNYGPGGTGISLSFWYKTQQTIGNAYLISFGGGGWGTYFEILNNHWSSQTTGPCYGPALTGGGTLISRGNANFPNENIWHHCVVILPTNAQSLNNVLFYFDGVLLNETCSFANYGAPAPNISTNNPIKFGSGYQDQGGVWSSFYEGLLDDIGIWNRSLSEEEIQSIYLPEAPVSGCTDETACNFNQDATFDDGSCIPSGCMDTYACNYNQEADCDDGSCDYTCCPGPGCCDDGTFWNEATQTCIVTNPTDTNFDGCTDLNDLMDILSAYGDCAVVETNYSLSFDGVDDYVDLGDIMNDLYQPLTFQIYTKFNGNGGVLFSTDNCGIENCNYNGYWMDVSTTEISIAYGDGEWHGGGERRTGRANVNLTAGEWYSITAIVRGPGDMNIFLDGESLEMNYVDGGFGGNVNFTENPFRIGQIDESYFHGLLDELRVWDIELNVNQIQSNFNAELNGNEENLIGYWDFNEGTGSTLTDQTSNGNDGTINGATWSTDVPTSP